jgi:hypothetical protein
MREIERCGYSATPVPVSDRFGDDPREWLEEQAGEHGLRTLLAHADDGVIWGRVDGGALQTSDSAFPDVSPPLRALTLQQARLFGPDAELLVWRDGEGHWQARLLQDDEQAEDRWRFDEAQILWGDHREDQEEPGIDEAQILWGDDREDQEEPGFTVVADGIQGLRHAVPLTGIEFPKSGVRPLRLGVRHYLEADENGMLAIVHSRLTCVWADGGKESSNG